MHAKIESALSAHCVTAAAEDARREWIVSARRVRRQLLSLARDASAQSFKRHCRPREELSLCRTTRYATQVMAEFRQRAVTVALGGCVLLASGAAAQVQADNEASPTTMIANMARELINKSYSNSQVLSLNLSNVLILLLIKAVLFAISQYSTTGGGKGFFGGNFWGRSTPSLDSQPRRAVDDHAMESELLLVLSYLSGERKGEYGCLFRVACEDPSGKAPQYLAAGRMLLKGARVMSSFITVSPKYGTVVDGLEEAIKHGSAGGQCSHYVCKTQPE